MQLNYGWTYDIATAVRLDNLAVQINKFPKEWEDLSYREKQVVAALCMKLTTRQVASRLGISPETVKTHVNHILVKFGIRSRIDLIVALEYYPSLALWRADNLSEPWSLKKQPEKKLEE